MAKSRLDAIKEALAKAAPPPEDQLELTGRRVVSEAFDEITEMKEAGHKFETIAEIITATDDNEDDPVVLAGSTLATYYRDEAKARRLAANRAKREAKRLERELTLTQGDDTSVRNPGSRVQTITAVLEDDDDEPQ